MPSAIDVGKPAITRGPWGFDNSKKATAAEIFKIGDPVILAAAGTISIAAAVDAVVGDVLIYGIALMNAVDALAFDVPVPCMIPEPGSEILLGAYHATPGSAKFQITDLDVPTTYPLINKATGWGVDIATNGTEDKVTLVAIDESYPAGTEFGNGWFRFIYAQTLWGSAA